MKMIRYFALVAITCSIAMGQFSYAQTKQTCNDMMNTRPVNNAMKFPNSEWRVGFLRYDADVENGFGVKGKPRSGKLVGYSPCRLEAGTPVAEHRLTGEIRIIQCGNPVKGIATSDIQFSEIVINEVPGPTVYVDKPGPTVYVDRPVPSPAPYVAPTSYVSQTNTSETMLALATAPMANLDASPMAAMERTIVDGSFRVVSSGVTASLWPRANYSNVTNVANHMVGQPTHPDAPDNPGGTPDIPDAPDNPGGTPFTPPQDALPVEPAPYVHPVQPVYPVNPPDNGGAGPAS